MIIIDKFVLVNGDFFTGNPADSTILSPRWRVIYISRHRIIPIEVHFIQPVCSVLTFNVERSSIELSRNHHCVFSRPSCRSTELIENPPGTGSRWHLTVRVFTWPDYKTANNDCETRNLGQRMLCVRYSYTVINTTSLGFICL